MDKDQIIHDLAILHLQKTTDNQLNADEMIIKYNEAIELYKKAYKNQPKSKIRVGKRSSLGL